MLAFAMMAAIRYRANPPPPKKKNENGRISAKKPRHNHAATDPLVNPGKSVRHCHQTRSKSVFYPPMFWNKSRARTEGAAGSDEVLGAVVGPAIVISPPPFVSIVAPWQQNEGHSRYPRIGGWVPVIVRVPDVKYTPCRPSGSALLPEILKPSFVHGVLRPW